MDRWWSWLCSKDLLCDRRLRQKTNAKNCEAGNKVPLRGHVLCFVSQHLCAPCHSTHKTQLWSIFHVAHLPASSKHCLLKNLLFSSLIPYIFHLLLPSLPHPPCEQITWQISCKSVAAIFILLFSFHYRRTVQGLRVACFYFCSLLNSFCFYFYTPLNRVQVCCFQHVLNCICAKLAFSRNKFKYNIYFG